MHLHPSISRDKLSTISDKPSSAESSAVVDEDDQDDVMIDVVDDDVDADVVPVTADGDILEPNVLHSWGKGYHFTMMVTTDPTRIA